MRDSTELPITTIHRCDMTEKLLNAALTRMHAHTRTQAYIEVKMIVRSL